MIFIPDVYNMETFAFETLGLAIAQHLSDCKHFAKLKGGGRSRPNALNFKNHQHYLGFALLFRN